MASKNDTFSLTSSSLCVKAELVTLKLVTKVHLAAFSAAETMQPVTPIPPVPQPIHKCLLHPSHDPAPVPQVLRWAEGTLVIPLVLFLVSKTHLL